MIEKCFELIEIDLIKHSKSLNSISKNTLLESSTEILVAFINASADIRQFKSRIHRLCKKVMAYSSADTKDVAYALINAAISRYCVDRNDISFIIEDITQIAQDWLGLEAAFDSAANTKSVGLCSDYGCSKADMCTRRLLVAVKGKIVYFVFLNSWY